MKEEMGDNLSLEERIYMLVKSKEHVSFAELERHFGDEMKGNRVITCRGENKKEMNCLIWTDMNNKFIETLIGMTSKKYLFINPSSILVYLCDGKVLPFPIAKRIPKEGYKEPHWIPTVFTTFKQPISIELNS